MSHVRWSVAVLEEQHPRIVTVDGGREVDVRIAGDCDSVARAGIFGEIEEDAFADHLALGGELQSGTVQNVKTGRSEEHTSELQSLMRISYAVFCLNKKTNRNQ